MVLVGPHRLFVGHFAEQMVHTSPDQPLVTHFRYCFWSKRALATFDDHQITAEAKAALVLRKMNHDSEINLSRPVDACVITAPAHIIGRQHKPVCLPPRQYVVTNFLR